MEMAAAFLLGCSLFSLDFLHGFLNLRLCSTLDLVLDLVHDLKHDWEHDLRLRSEHYLHVFGHVLERANKFRKWCFELNFELKFEQWRTFLMRSINSKRNSY